MLIQELLDVLPLVSELSEFDQKECARALRDKVILAEELETMTGDERVTLANLHSAERRQKRHGRSEALRRRLRGSE